MAYRTGNHWGVTIVGEGTGPTDPQGRRTGDELVAVVVNGDSALAERICALLNADEPYDPPECGCPVARLRGRAVQHTVQCPEGETARFVVNPPKVYHQPEKRGSDSEGYGRCTGCGEMWPCAAYRVEARP